MNELIVEVVRELDFPPDRIWPVLADFANFCWVPGPERVDAIGSGIGMMRRIHMPRMEPIDEVLEAIDHTAYTLSYTIPRGMPLPVSNYRATVRLELLPGDRTRISWGARAEATTAVETARQAVEAAYTQMIGWLDAYLRRI